MVLNHSRRRLALAYDRLHKFLLTQIKTLLLHTARVPAIPRVRLTNEPALQSCLLTARCLPPLVTRLALHPQRVGTKPSALAGTRNRRVLEPAHWLPHTPRFRRLQGRPLHLHLHLHSLLRYRHGRRPAGSFLQPAACSHHRARLRLDTVLRIVFMTQAWYSEGCGACHGSRFQ